MSTVWCLSGFCDFKKKEMQKQRMKCEALPSVTHCSSHCGEHRRAKLQNQTGLGGWGGNTANLFVQEWKSSSFTEDLALDFYSSFLLLEGKQINLIEKKPEIARLHLWTGIWHREAESFPRPSFAINTGMIHTGSLQAQLWKDKVNFSGTDKI